jgi:hypothetical protein
LSATQENIVTPKKSKHDIVTHLLFFSSKKNWKISLLSITYIIFFKINVFNNCYFRLIINNKHINDKKLYPVKINVRELRGLLVSPTICGLQSIIDKCRICRTEGETIEHIISSCTVLAQSEYKKRHDIFAKIIHMNLAIKFNLLKNTQPHYSYKSESCLEHDNYKLYFDQNMTIKIQIIFLTDIHIKHNRLDIIILNKQQKQAYLLDIAVPNSRNTYNTDI